MSKTYYIYILANEFGTIYVGMTNNLERRISEHKSGTIEGFTKKYSCHKLVYMEETNDVETCIRREKQIKKWSRFKKSLLINKENPEWKDLSMEWFK